MTFTANDLKALCTKHLDQSLLDRSGSVLYSGESTLKKGDFYFLGYNPGGPANDIDLIKDNIALPGNCNAFLDQKWGSEKGQACLQKRVDQLLTALGAKTRDVCATNLIFVRSPSSSSLGDPIYLARKCWNVHEELLRIVKPRIILCHGRAAFDFVKNRGGAFGDQEQNADHGNWKCRSANLAAGPLLLGVPHLSRYDPIRKSVLPWLLERVEARVSSP